MTRRYGERQTRLEHQPIRDLSNGSAAGSELYLSLGGVHGSRWHEVDAETAANGLTRTLDLVPCALSTVTGVVSVNLDPRIIDGRIEGQVLRAAEACQRQGRVLILEILETRPLPRGWTGWVRRWQAEGVRFVFDDVEPGDDRLEHSRNVDGLKIAGSVIEWAVRGDARAVRFVRDCIDDHPFTVAEGIGSGDAFCMAVDLGVPLVQGFIVGGRREVMLAGSNRWGEE